MKAIIIDDEQHCIETLLYQLKKYPAIQVLQTFNKPADAINVLLHEAIDILFLDINMPTQSGLDLVKQLPNINAKIIFTTAHEQYAIQAIKLAAFDYLLKPIDDDDLDACVNKLLASSNTHSIQQIQLLQQILKYPNQLPEKIALPTDNGLHFVEAASIIRCQSNNNYTNIYFSPKNSLLICRTLKDVEEVLSNYNFLRVHQSHLVNSNCIEHYSKADGGFITLTNGEKIPVTKWNKEWASKYFSKI